MATIEDSNLGNPLFTLPNEIFYLILVQLRPRERVAFALSDKTNAAIAKTWGSREAMPAGYSREELGPFVVKKHSVLRGCGVCSQRPLLFRSLELLGSSACVRDNITDFPHDISSFPRKQFLRWCRFCGHKSKAITYDSQVPGAKTYS